MEIQAMQQQVQSVPCSTVQRVGVAVAPDCFPEVLLRWCFRNGVLGARELVMVYVSPPLRSIPSPMGKLPVSQVSEFKLAQHLSAQEKHTHSFEHRLQTICECYKVKAEFVVVESDEVGKTLVEQIEKYQFCKFILGASRRFVRIRAGVSGYVMNHAPDYCTVQCLSKTSKLVSSRDANASNPTHADKKMKSCIENFETTQPITLLESNAAHFRSISSGSTISPYPLSRASSNGFDLDDTDFTLASSSGHTTEENEENNREHKEVTESYEPRTPEPCTVDNRNSFHLEVEDQEVAKSDVETLKQRRTYEAGECSSSRASSGNTSAKELHEQGVSFQTSGRITSNLGHSKELEMLKLQLQNAKLAVIKAKEAARIEYEEKARWALRKAEEMAIRRVEEEKKREAAVMAADLARKKLQEESQKHAEALRLVESMSRALKDEIRKNEEARKKILMQGKEAQTDARHFQYTEFSYAELQVMTDNFAARNKLGAGGYGCVYRGKYCHTDVAVKVLNRDGLQGYEEFKQEVEVLSRIHHPHIVLLLGGCSEHGCLIYEYLENGSLEDVLCSRNNSLPISCFNRYRIAVQTATALLFLHRARPQPIVHRDLKPANILLGKNLHSKISDVGCARFMPDNGATARDTSPVGTFAYIDPEYQREGSISPKSDVYAFGIILLQLLTASSPVGIVNKVTVALERGSVMEILDERAGTWPLAAAMQLAYIGLACAEPERKDRIELDQVLDMLLKMGDMFQSENDELDRPGGAPAMFQCPIVKEVMEYPVVAADGYTYEYQAIKLWLDTHNTSPMTNLPLEHKHLTANRLIRSAIWEWRAQRALHL